MEGVNDTQIVHSENETRCPAASSSGTQIIRYSGSRRTRSEVAGQPGRVAGETVSVNARPRRPLQDG
ncbi:hypothetical protein ACVWW3_002693 [Bradyrhizobium sp. LM2.9]